MVAWKHQREHNRGQGIPGPLSGRPGTAFWTTRDRLIFLFPRRTTRLRREPYEGLGACKLTSPVRFLGESNVT